MADTRLSVLHRVLSRAVWTRRWRRNTNCQLRLRLSLLTILPPPPAKRKCPLREAMTLVGAERVSLSPLGCWRSSLFRRLCCSPNDICRLARRENGICRLSERKLLGGMDEMDKPRLLENAICDLRFEPFSKASKVRLEARDRKERDGGLKKELIRRKAYLYTPSHTCSLFLSLSHVHSYTIARFWRIIHAYNLHLRRMIDLVRFNIGC